MVGWHVLHPSTRHLQQYQTSRRTLIPVKSTQLALIHSRSGLVVGHEDQTSQISPFVGDLFEPTHHPAGEAALLILLEDEYVGEICKGDVVSDDTCKAC